MTTPRFRLHPPRLENGRVEMDVEILMNTTAGRIAWARELAKEFRGAPRWLAERLTFLVLTLKVPATDRALRAVAWWAAENDLTEALP